MRGTAFDPRGNVFFSKSGRNTRNMYEAIGAVAGRLTERKENRLEVLYRAVRYPCFSRGLLRFLTNLLSSVQSPRISRTIWRRALGVKGF